LFNIHQTHNMSKYVELYANFYVVFAYLSMFMIYDGVIFI